MRTGNIYFKFGTQLKGESYALLRLVGSTFGKFPLRMLGLIEFTEMILKKLGANRYDKK
jgi:hypothetical protein